jgi:hypothetical protein
MNKEQRITEAESNEAWSIFADREKYLSLSKDEEVLVDAYVEARQIKQASGEFPTLAEVIEKWSREKAEQERTRLRSWQAHYRFNAKDIVEYEALLAREESGPFMTFMSVVAHLKVSTGNFPTVGEVRSYCDANQKSV